MLGQHHQRSRALGPGSAGALVLVGTFALLASGCSSSHATKAKDGFGSYPAFLPKSTVESGSLHQVVDASAEHPALATQGDPVRVHLGKAAVTVTVTGPEVPNEGLPDPSSTSPATWTFTLSGATAPVILDPATFQAVDEAGSVYRLTPVAGSAVPHEVGPGQTVTFKQATQSFSVGEGRMRWIPSGHLAPVEWDFVVEDD